MRQEVKPRKKEEILRQAGRYSFSTQVTQLITLVAAVLSRRFLGPAQTGIWTTLQVLVDYSKYSTMGTLEAASREIPRHVGAGDIKSADEIKNLTFSFVVASSVFVAGSILIGACVTFGRLSAEVTYGLFFVAALIFLQRINNLLVALLRCYKRFDVESVFMIASAVVNACLVALLTYRFKIYGFIWALILSFVFNILFLFSRYNYDFQWNLNRRKLQPMLTYGLPLMIIGVLGVVLKSVDKLMISKLLGFEALGFYSIALMACSYINNFSISVEIVLIPHFHERFGAKPDARQMAPYLFKSSKAYTLTLPAMIGMAWVFLPMVVHFVLPKFYAGIPAMRILTLSLFFTALIQPFHTFLITTRNHIFLFPILFLTLAVSVLMDWAVIRAGWGIEGVATASLAAALLNFILVYFTAAYFFAGGMKSFSHLFKIFAVFIYFFGMLNLILKTNVSYGFLIFCAAYLPLFFILNKEFGIIIPGTIQSNWRRFFIR